MRILAVFLLIGALFGVSCQSPARSPDLAGPKDAQALTLPVVPGPPFPVPDGFPLEGISPRDAFYQKKENVWVVSTGTVIRILRDDTKRPRHQRFIVDYGGGRTVLIAHNIDQAPRVPFKRGDAIAFRGKYVWNDDGGVVHWTHRDSRSKKGGGWIIWKGQNFR